MDTREDSPLVELLFAFILVFALQLVTSVGGLVGGLFVLSPPITTNPWTVVTSVYAHASVGHLVSNAVALVLFGWPVARATTRTRFHLFFLVTGALAGVAQIVLTNFLAGAPVISWLVDVIPGVDVTATGGVLGASGAVFALLGYLLASNRLSSSLAETLRVPPWVSYVVFVAVAGVLTLATASPGAAVVAHFTGLLLGLLAGRVNLLSTRPARSDRRPRGSDARR